MEWLGEVQSCLYLWDLIATLNPWGHVDLSQFPMLLSELAPQVV